MINHNKPRKGIVLASFLFLSVLLCAMILYFHEHIMRDKLWEKNLIAEKQALHLSGGGVLQALSMLKNDPSLSGEIIQFESEGFQLLVSIEDTQSNIKRIRSKGIVEHVIYEATELFDSRLLDNQKFQSALR